MSNIVKEAKAKVKAEKKADRKNKLKQFASVAKHYAIAGVIIAVAFGLSQLRQVSYQQGYEAGLKEGEQSASAIDRTVIERTKEIKELLKEISR
jgi:flagellar biosynthesis/type III secretory pathway protein FliH